MFDLLADVRGRDLTARPLFERRAALDAFAAEHFAGDGPIRLSPTTNDRTEASRWLTGGRQGLDGVMAKLGDAAYASGERTAMVKVKRMRTADCVVGGFRRAAKGGLGSLLLGLHEGGLLHHVGFCSAMDAETKAEARRKVEALAGGVGFSGRAPGGPSRWRKEGSDDWVPVRPELAVEVQYDHFSGGRFRHGTKFVRWRADKAPGSCKLAQVEKEAGEAMGML